MQVVKGINISKISGGGKTKINPFVNKKQATMKSSTFEERRAANTTTNGSNSKYRSNQPPDKLFLRDKTSYSRSSRGFRSSKPTDTYESVTTTSTTKTDKPTPSLEKPIISTNREEFLPSGQQNQDSSLFKYQLTQKQVSTISPPPYYILLLFLLTPFLIRK